MSHQKSLPGKIYHHEKKGIHIFVNPYWGGKFVTDDTGALVIELIKQESDEEQRVNLIAERLSINPYEAAARLVTFMEQLDRRRMLGEADASPHDDIPQPEFGFLEVTRKCDTRCRLCYIDSGRERPDNMSQGEIFRAIDQLADLGVANVALTGGDPLTREDLPEIIEYIHDNKKLKPAISTSLLSLNDETARKLGELDVAVQVSLDGSTAETNDWNRGKGSFDKTMRGFELLKKYNVTFRLASVINKHNFNDVEKIVALGVELGAREVAFGKVKIAGRSARLSEPVMPTVEEMSEVYHKLYRCDIDTRELDFKVGCKHNQVLLTGLNERVGCLPCGAGRTFVHVSYNGDVLPCSLFNDCAEFRVGNIREDKMTDLWSQSSIYKYFRETTAEDVEVCKSCPVKYLCGGGCRADAYVNHGDLNANCGDCKDLLTYYDWILNRGCQEKFITAF
ncbi:MAG: PqqD family peptide modification chaperone [Candidatus Zixiibacteriota bacterium]